MPLTTSSSDLRAARCRAALLCLGAAGALWASQAWPGLAGAELRAPLQLFELVSIIVSLMIVSMAWHKPDDEPQRQTHPMVLGFALVAGLDLIHALGEDHHGSALPADAAGLLIFWSARRIVELAALLMLLRDRQLPLPRTASLLTAGALVLAIFAVSRTAGGDPSTLAGAAGAAGSVLDGFELVLTAFIGVIALAFWLRGRREGSVNDAWIAASCFLLALGDHSLHHVDGADLPSLVGHALRVMAYLILFRMVYLAEVRKPHALLQASERALRAKKSELKALLTHMPIGAMRLGPSLEIAYLNRAQAELFGSDPDALVERDVRELPLVARQPGVLALLEAAVAGQAGQIDLGLDSASGRSRRLHLQTVPDAGEAGGAYVFVSDVTDRHAVQLELQASLKDVAELQAALDAHAIVAVTDARGVITRVNEKFCQISKYGRDELVGHTHRLINSGHHPTSFFEELWHTISRGEVWNGEICNRAKDGELYWVHTTIVPYIGADGRPVQYVAIRADITKRKRAEQAAQHMAFYDALTGLPNRRLMLERLQAAMHESQGSGRWGALYFVDLDNFKQVNDTLGHDRGDRLLEAVAHRLDAQVTAPNLVARFGGDEFVILAPMLGADREAAFLGAGELGAQLLESLARPYALGRDEIVSTPSIGISLFRGQELPVEELLKQADMALYQAKDGGRNQICFFDPELQAELNANAALEVDLRRALSAREFHLAYQPVVDALGRTHGVEALLRWTQAQRGAVSPAVFIPIAEQTGLILQIGAWVLDEACAQLARWAGDALTCGLTIAVNVSVRQFRHPDFVQQVTEALARHGVAGSGLKIELTESMLLDAHDEVSAKMRALQALGVHFALDDFGTGYSSLSYLKLLPLEQLKIDRSFVRDLETDPNDAAIARTILSLARSLDIDVVAEGVETRAQFEILRGMDCRNFQGWYFGRPTSAAAIAERLGSEQTASA